MGENHPAHVDIIIAARNEERYLAHCLEALKAQDYPEERLQIYLVDNGSTDRTVTIAKEYGINVFVETKPGLHKPFKVQLFDMTGRLVMTRMAATTGFSLDVSTLQKGMYILRIFSSKQALLTTEKILIQ